MLACVVSGLALSTFAAQDHIVSAAGRIHMLGLLLSGAAAFVLVLWARRQIPLHRVVALYGLGGVVGGRRRGSARAGSSASPSPRRSSSLGLVEASGSRIRAAAVVAALGVYGVFDGYRSFFAFCLLAATLTVWQMRPNGRGSRAEPMVAGHPHRRTWARRATC